MKKSLCFILIASIVVLGDTFCQDYWSQSSNANLHEEENIITSNMENAFIPIIDTKHKWIKNQNFQGQAPEPRLIFYGDDTFFINGQTYFELLVSLYEDGELGVREGLYREVDGRIYRKENLDEVLYLDMNLEEGDTFLYGEDELLVTAVDVVQYADGVERKKIVMSCDPDDPDSRVITLVEGIGYMDEYNDDCTQLVDTPLSLVCFEHDGESVYSDSTSESCWLISSVEEARLFDFSIYPNPSSEEIMIDAKSKILQVDVLDVNGQLLMSDHSEALLNVSKLSGGVYMIRVYTEDGIGIRKLMKI